jgi:hypothetical protein
MDALESEDAWVGSDTIYVITSVDKSLIESWFSDFEVSDVSELDYERHYGSKTTAARL